MEFAILDWIQGIRFGLLDALMVFTTKLGDAGLFWIVLSLILTAYKPTRKLGLACVFSLVLSLVITNLGLKNIVGRARPYTHVDIELLIPERWDYSFPSGHTSAAFAVAFLLMKEKFTIKNFKVYIPIVILAALMAFSRVYLYVHYPSDVIASLFIAYGCSLLGILMAKKITKSETLM